MMHFWLTIKDEQLRVLSKIHNIFMQFSEGINTVGVKEEKSILSK